MFFINLCASLSDSISSKRNFNLSPPSPSVTMFQRPRSASLHQTPISLAGKKKSYRAISRSRPSSAKLGSGRHRSESLNFEQEAIAGTLKVEEQFAMIKTQLVSHRLLCKGPLAMINDQTRVLIATCMVQNHRCLKCI